MVLINSDEHKDRLLCLGYLDYMCGHLSKPRNRQPRLLLIKPQGPQRARGVKSSRDPLPSFICDWKEFDISIL
jgi:hypothetical protein